MTAIVTGAGGFIGRWLVKQLLNEGHTVVAAIRPGSSDLDWLSGHERLEIVECDIENYLHLPDLLGRRDGSVFYHLAWAGVSGVSRGSLKVQMKNIYTAGEAVKVASAIGCAIYIGIGSIMEEESVTAAKTDGVEPGDSYIYGQAKQFAHLYTEVMASRCKLPYIWVALTNVYGEYDFSSRFIMSTLKKIKDREKLEFTMGTQLYDFIYVGDVVRALSLIGRQGKCNRTYLVGSGYPRQLKEFVEIIGKQLAPEQELHFGKVPYSGVQLSEECFCIDKVKCDVGYEPEMGFEEGIERTMRWIRNNS